MLPDAYDMNDDTFEIVFDEAELIKWAHFITYDGVSIVVVDPKLMTEDDIQFAIKEEVIEIPLKVVDAKGYSAEYTLEIEFEIEIPEEPKPESTFAGVVILEFEEVIEEEVIEDKVIEEEEEQLDPDLIA